MIMWAPRFGTVVKLLELLFFFFSFHFKIKRLWATCYSGPEGAESRFRLSFLFVFLVFRISCAVTQPKLGYKA